MSLGRRVKEVAVQNPLVVSGVEDKNGFVCLCAPFARAVQRKAPGSCLQLLFHFDRLNFQGEGTEHICPNGCEAQPGREFIQMWKRIFERIFSSNEIVIIGCCQIKLEYIVF